MPTSRKMKDGISDPSIHPVVYFLKDTPMKKLAALLFSIILAFSAIAREPGFTPPNYKKIRKSIEKQGSKTWYPTLMNRLQQNDTTLTPGEYHLLYYGYTLRQGYQPYAEYPLADSLKNILKKEELTEEDYRAIIRFGTGLLAENPFEITLLDPLIYAYWMTGNGETASKLEFRFGRLLETIFSSGDGLTKNTAFHVITVAHEYDMLRALGFIYGGQQQLVEGKYDHLKVAKNDFGIEGFFFDISTFFGKFTAK